MCRTKLHVAAVFALGTLCASALLAAKPGAALSRHAQELLAAARTQGKPTVTLLIATRPGGVVSVVSGLTALGANVRYRDDALGYVSVIIGTAQVEVAAGLNGVQAVDLDEIVPLDDPRPKESATVNVAPPGPGTPPANPYLPTQDIGAPDFVAANPTFDGRGVTIGIVDTGIDLLTPELQSAKTGAGALQRKIVDWVTFTDPLVDQDPTWINMKDQVNVTGGTFTYQGVNYTGVQGSGQYRVGLFREADLGAGSEYAIGCGADVNRNGICKEVFAVLWDTKKNIVYVDANADLSFAGEPPMMDYKVRFDTGTFGTDNPATPQRESVPFVIQTDGKNKFVNIGIVAGAHGTHVAGIAAGKGFFGGAFNGVAPEARIVSVRACLFSGGCTAHGMIEGMIYATKQANADAVNMSIGGLPALNDGNAARDILYNRLIDQTKAQMFFSAGNSGPGINTVGDPSVATGVMSVGAYVSKETWYSDYGAFAAKDDGLFVFSSRGPREDGGFKPNIIAPGAAISCVPAWQPGQPVPGTYALPPGYAMFNGTSMAAPMATGGAALLISAAKQWGAQHKPDQLREAISSSARFLPAYGAHEQGNGLFQVGGAWNLLRANIKTAEIASSAPVNTIIAEYLAVPYKGPGIYEREGWAPGMSGQRSIIFTRTQGGAQPVTYNLIWVGNDGTFSSAASIALPLNTPVVLPVSVYAETAGVHSAILNLDDPATVGTDYQVMNTIVAAYQFTVENNFAVTVAGSADRPDKATFFFYVPPDTPAFQAGVNDVNGRVRILRFHPYGLPYDSTDTTPYQTGGSQLRTASNPTSGVWELTVDTSRASTTSPATFTVTASLLGVTIDPPALTINPATVGATYTQVFTFTNRFGSFTGGAVGTALDSKFAATPIIQNGRQQTFTVMVPSGSTRIQASLAGAADPAADLDLFLYDCTGAGCVLRSASTTSTSIESVSAANPAAGPWVVLVDAYAVPAGATAYNYSDQFANPMFGSIGITDPPSVHAYGASWSSTASIVPNAAPSPERFLAGEVQVRSGSAILGRAPVSLFIAP